MGGRSRIAQWMRDFPGEKVPIGKGFSTRPRVLRQSKLEAEARVAEDQAMLTRQPAPEPAHPYRDPWVPPPPPPRTPPPPRPLGPAPVPAPEVSCKRRGRHTWNGKPWEASKALTDMTFEELDELERQVALARERGDLPKVQP